jgi:photosystem II stability/assembly factor-like uncharacterized protein
MQPHRRLLAALAASLIHLFQTAPGDAQWIRQFSGTNVRLTDLTMLDSLTAVAVGYGLVILKTTDGGDTWQKKLSNGPNLNAVAFSTSLTGVAVGDNRTLLVSSDTGETWQSRAIGGVGNFLSVAHPDADRIYVGNDRGRLRFTTDAGATWRDTSLGSLTLTDITLIRGSGEVSYSGQVISPYTAYRSTDNGGSWDYEIFPLSLAGTALRGDVSPAGVYFAVGYDAAEPPFARVMRRRPQDSVWTNYSFPQPGPSVVLRDICAASATVLYACGSGGTILRSLNGGDVWVAMTSGTTRRLNAIDFVGEKVGMAAGDSGTVLTTVNGTTFADEPAGELPHRATLFPNVPNPFNPSTVLVYELPRGMEITLTVFDLLGRRIATLASGTHAAGRHAVRFDGAGLSSGVYVARLEWGEGSEVRMMTLIR